jgi:hypothetical protein
MVTGPVYEIHCQLRGAEPPIWRRLVIPAALHLEEFHAVLLSAMDWYGDHLWRFSVGSRRYTPGKRSQRSRLLVHPKPKGPLCAMVRDLLSKVGDTALYEYDFGDGWEVDLRLESIQDMDPHTNCPRCTAGALAAPPDDCGGLPGFEWVKAALADPQHPDHDEALEMVPEGWDAAVCNLEAINADMPALDDLCSGDEDPDEPDPAEEAALATILEIRVRDEQHLLLRRLLDEHPTGHPAPAAALEQAAPHKKGRVIRAERRVWNHFLELLERQEESEDFQRARQVRELRALIAETR